MTETLINQSDAEVEVGRVNACSDGGGDLFSGGALPTSRRRGIPTSLATTGSIPRGWKIEGFVRWLVALALVVCLLAGPPVLAQATEAAGNPDEVVELLRDTSNLQQLIERTLKTPGDNWLRHVEVEQDRLRNLLHSRGYLDGQLQLQHVDASTNPSVTVRVEPGDLYFISAVELSGGTIKGPAAKRILDNAIGEVASTANAASIAGQLIWELGEQGHPSASLVESAFVTGASRGQAVLKLVLDVPPQARFEALEIEGNGAELNSKIEALQPFAKGQLYSSSRMAEFREAVGRLAGTSSARIETEPQPDGTFRLRVQRVVQQPNGGLEAVAGMVLLLATLVVVAQRRIILTSLGSGDGIRLNAITIGVAALLLISAVLVFNRALTFLSGSA